MTQNRRINKLLNQLNKEEEININKDKKNTKDIFNNFYERMTEMIEEKIKKILLPNHDNNYNKFDNLEGYPQTILLETNPDLLKILEAEKVDIKSMTIHGNDKIIKYIKELSKINRSDYIERTYKVKEIIKNVDRLISLGGEGCYDFEESSFFRMNKDSIKKTESETEEDKDDTGNKN